MSTFRSQRWQENANCQEYDRAMNRLGLEWADRDKSGSAAVREARDGEIREDHAWRQKMLREYLDEVLRAEGLQVKEGWGERDYEYDLVPLEEAKEA